MAKLTLNSIGSRYGSIDALNDNFDSIEQAVENTLSRDGTGPNAMESNLDMNGNTILNVSSLEAASLTLNGQIVVPTNLAISTLPTQTGQSGKYLSTDGTAAFWQTPSSSQVTFVQSGVGAQSRTVQSKLRDIVSVKDFGAVGNNVADDTAAVSAAITHCLSLPYSPVLKFPAGYYRLTSALPNLTNAITVQGEGPRDTQLMLNGTAPIINVIGSGTRATDIVFSDLMINGNGMTAGFSVVVDWAQDIKFLNVSFNNPYNGVSLRQCGNTIFDNVVMGTVRGALGVYAYAANTTRNGENDQVDVLSFSNCIIQSNYVPGGGVPIAELVVLDGRVHTVHFNGLRLLSGLRGIRTRNTPALAQNFVPRFLTGSGLECENHYAEPMLFDACTDVWLDNIFAAGSSTENGIQLSPSVANWCVNKGSINSNNLAGIDINGALAVSINDVTIYNNSFVGAGVKSGVVVNGSGVFSMSGGLAGKATWMPAYTETQKYGIDISAGFGGTVLIQEVDLRGNNVGALFDGGSTTVSSQVRACPGYNPRGTVLQTVGASPFTYTAGLTQETVNIYGGSGVTATIGGVAVMNVSPGAFVLHPRQTVTLTYLTTPTMAINRA